MTEDQKRDKYYKKTYGISLDLYNIMLAQKDGGCWGCGWTPTKDQNRLAVDHVHFIPLAFKMDGQWAATCYLLPGAIFLHKFKYKAIADCKETVKPYSVRGLLCWKCNSLIQKSQDSPDRLAGTSQYLRNFEKKIEQRVIKLIVDKSPKV